MAFDASGENRVEVVGESFYRDALRHVAAAAGGKTRDRVAYLVPNPSNPYDSNAVEVHIAGNMSGTCHGTLPR